MSAQWFRLHSARGTAPALVLVVEGRVAACTQGVCSFGDDWAEEAESFRREGWTVEELPEGSVAETFSNNRRNHGASTAE